MPQRGWTGTHDADSLFNQRCSESYENLDLNFRVHFSLNQNDYLFCISKGRRSIKIYADGAIGSRGAALFREL